jgi:putative endopeptidase
MTMNKYWLLLSITACSVGFAQKKSGIRLELMDKNIDPKQDFYQYACGAWLKSNTIPETESAWGSFNEIKDRNDKNLDAILKEISKDKTAKPGTNRQKIRDFYNLAMDTIKLEKDGIKYMDPYLKSIDKIATTDDLIKTMASFHNSGIETGFGFYVFSDMKNSTANAAYLAQAGTFLPDKDYYFEAKYEPIRTAYMKHLENMFLLFKFYPESAKANADIVFKVEKALASKMMNRLEQRDIEKQYNKFPKGEVYKKYPNLKLDMYFPLLGVKAVPNDLIVSQPDFMANLNDMIKSVPLNEWKVYLKFCVMHEGAPYLNKEIVQENFSFYATTLSGAKVQKPRWKTSLTATDGALGEALGQEFVEKYFNADSKKKVNEMVDNLMAAYKERILSRSWMSDSTKKNAIYKLEKISRKLGYPDKWKDYSTLAIKPDAYVLNHFRVNKFGYKDMINDIGKPVDKSKWGMTPPTVNAYYNPTNNEIAFPAGIMQIPFFDGSADDAFNYGIMGSIIGHELTHGFDDQGAQFDAVGNFQNWWTEVDIKNFESRTDKLVNQFNSYIAVDSTHVNGELTLGENIADLGGLTMAYYAYKKSLGGKKSEIMDGFTGEQRFFLAWAQGWKIMMRPQALKQLVATNPHAPGNFRANGPLTNMPEFYEAWGVKENDKMYRKTEERAEIW